MGSCNDIEQSFKQVWVSGYLCWCETTKLNSVQLNLPLWALKLALLQSRQKGKIDSACIDISIQYNASKWNHSSRVKQKAFITNMCQNQSTIAPCLSGVPPPGKPDCCSIQMFTLLTTGLFEQRKASSINFNKFIAAVFLSFAFSQLQRSAHRVNVNWLHEKGQKVHFSMYLCRLCSFLLALHSYANQRCVASAEVID